MTVQTTRVRITTTPPAKEFAEYAVHHLRVGQVYELSARLAELSVLSGYPVLEGDGQFWNVKGSSHTERKHR